MSTASIQPIASHTTPAILYAPPAKLVPFLQAAYDKVRRGGFSSAFIAAGLKKDILGQSLPAPSDNEIYIWIIDVQQNKVQRPGNNARIGFGLPCMGQASLDQQIEINLSKARSVIRSFHSFITTRKEVDYGLTDQIAADSTVRHAIDLLISADANKHEMPTTKANRLVDLLLSSNDPSLERKLVDILTRELQSEICSLLVKHGHATDPNEMVAA